jgi:hypothetical protein
LESGVGVYLDSFKIKISHKMATKNIMLLPSCLEIRDQLGEGMTIAQLRKAFPMHTKRTLESEIKTGLETGYILLERGIFKDAKAVQNTVRGGLVSLNGDVPKIDTAYFRSYFNDWTHVYASNGINSAVALCGCDDIRTDNKDSYTFGEILAHVTIKNITNICQKCIDMVKDCPHAVSKIDTVDVPKIDTHANDIIQSVLSNVLQPFTAPEIAQRTDVIRNHASGYKSAKRAVSLEKALLIASKLGVGTEFIERLAQEMKNYLNL